MMGIEEGEGVTAGETVTGMIFGWRRKKVTWPWLVGSTCQRGKGETGYRFGFLRWAADLFRYWAEIVPGALFLFLFLLSLFPFLFSCFFYIFCKNASNQIKPISKILQNSQQGF
jgi:hypothetical protein